MNDIISQWELKETYAYLDDVTICWATVEEHEENLKRFLDAAKVVGLTINKEKYKFGVEEVCILGYCISQGTFRPDPERLHPLSELPVPHDKKSLQRLVGLFAYYAKWIPGYSEKICPLIEVIDFPLDPVFTLSINWKKDSRKLLSMSYARTRRHSLHSRNRRVRWNNRSNANTTKPTRRLLFLLIEQRKEKHHIVEKEAYAIVEAIRKWRHFLTKHFVLIVDQRSVSFMFNNRKSNKIKNERILRWRIELSPLSYTIQYRPGSENIPADTLSRSQCAYTTLKLATELKNLSKTSGIQPPTAMFAQNENRSILNHQPRNW